MKFQFNIDLTDKDYVDFNIFWQTKSRYGKNPDKSPYKKRKTALFAPFGAYLL